MIIIKMLSTEKATLQNFKRELNNDNLAIYEIEEVIKSLKKLEKLTSKKAKICFELSQIWESDNANRFVQHKEYLLAVNDVLIYEKMLEIAEDFLHDKLNENTLND